MKSIERKRNIKSSFLNKDNIDLNKGKNKISFNSNNNKDLEKFKLKENDKNYVNKNNSESLEILIKDEIERTKIPKKKKRKFEKYKFN